MFLPVLSNPAKNILKNIRVTELSSVETGELEEWFEEKDYEYGFPTTAVSECSGLELEFLERSLWQSFNHLSKL